MVKCEAHMCAVFIAPIEIAMRVDCRSTFHERKTLDEVVLCMCFERRDLSSTGSSGVCDHVLGDTFRCLMSKTCLRANLHTSFTRQVGRTSSQKGRRTPRRIPARACERSREVNAFQRRTATASAGDRRETDRPCRMWLSHTAWSPSRNSRGPSSKKQAREPSVSSPPFCATTQSAFHMAKQHMLLRSNEATLMTLGTAVTQTTEEEAAQALDRGRFVFREPVPSSARTRDCCERVAAVFRGHKEGRWAESVCNRQDGCPCVGYSSAGRCQAQAKHQQQTSAHVTSLMHVTSSPPLQDGWDCRRVRFGASGQCVGFIQETSRRHSQLSCG